MSNNAALMTEAAVTTREEQLKAELEMQKKRDREADVMPGSRQEQLYKESDDQQERDWKTR